MKRIVLTILFSLVACFVCIAQENSDEPVENQPAKQTELAGKYKKWLKKEVAYIITSDEKKAFDKLENDEDREAFIENFWLRRDPNPDTEVNEFREEYFERIKYANENFESGIPGWMTDRGRIHIIWGKPDKIEKGYGTFEENLDVPYEKWFFEHIDGCCDGVEITFIDPTETGEFRAFKPKTEPDLAERSEGGSL